MIRSLNSLLHSSIRLRQDGLDKLYWIPSKRGQPKVCSCYNALIPHDSTPFPWFFMKFDY
jgi:hypothetical protein